MKKSISTLVLSFAVFTAFCQVTIIDRLPGAYPTGNTDYSITSGESDRFGTTAYTICADKFTLTQTTQLLTADFYGENESNSFTPSNFSIFIVRNSGTGLPLLNNGANSRTIIGNLLNSQVSLLRIPLGPGFSISQFNTITNRTDIAIDFTAANGNNPVILPAGDYWMIAAQYVPDGSPGEITFYWGWLGSTDAAPVRPKYLYNTFFSRGWNDVSYSVVGTNVLPNSLAWRLIGDVNVSSIDETSVSGLSVFPNPTTDILNLDLPENAVVNDMKIYTISGQEVNLKLSIQEGKIDVSSLIPGVYVLSGQTSLGAFNKKIVKI